MRHIRCILPKIPGYTIEPTTVLNVLGENEKPFREFIQSALKKSSGSISASITLTNHDGEVRHFNCACLQSPQATAYKNVVDVVPGTLISPDYNPQSHYTLHFHFVYNIILTHYNINLLT